METDVARTLGHAALDEDGGERRGERAKVEHEHAAHDRAHAEEDLRRRRPLLSGRRLLRRVAAVAVVVARRERHLERRRRSRRRRGDELQRRLGAVAVDIPDAPHHDQSDVGPLDDGDRRLVLRSEPAHPPGGQARRVHHARRPQPAHLGEEACRGEGGGEPPPALVVVGEYDHVDVVEHEEGDRARRVDAVVATALGVRAVVADGADPGQAVDAKDAEAHEELGVRDLADLREPDWKLHHCEPERERRHHVARQKVAGNVRPRVRDGREVRQRRAVLLEDARGVGKGDGREHRGDEHRSHGERRDAQNNF